MRIGTIVRATGLLLMLLTTGSNACPTSGLTSATHCLVACVADANPHSIENAPLSLSSASLSSTSPDDGKSTIDVIIQNFSFIPAAIVVSPGDVVRWTNLDAIGHTSTHLTLAAPLWDSGLLEQDQSFSHAFSDLGVFDYFCGPHGSSMLGTVTVAVPEPATIALASLAVAVLARRRQR